MAAAQPCFSYDVFLSFRGVDTRKTFTDNLYRAMKQAGIRTFRDDDALERGKMLKPELKKAVHQSAISLIVFSKSYASSTWCLDEVSMIIEEHETLSSKHEVVPVFYNVNPSDVRNQTGSFKEAFDRYGDIINAETNLQKKREWLEKVGAWRDSLRKAGSLTGMVSTDRYEAGFIIDIVNVIRKKLDYKALYIEEKLVGINESVAVTESWLHDPSPDAVILLIDGMGGIGKSTIAKCIYNSNFRKYDNSCFLANINEASNQPGGLLRLQSQLLSTILKSEKEETVWNVLEGTNKITRAISNKKVLLILDDVTTLQQLEALLGPQRFYSGSKVIITTRHKWLLTAFKDDLKVKIQSVRTLSTVNAIELFSLYAFHQNQSTEPYIAQSQLFVDHCKGLPLALKVLGSSLRGKTNDVWEDTMRKLEAIPNHEIQKVLQISYETLADDMDKDLFLHVACFFEGEEKDYIVKLLVECGLFPVVGIKNLMDRCLLYVEDGRVMMHQLVKEMGREVVRQEAPKDPGKRSRLWNHEDCFNVLHHNTGTKEVEGFMLDMQKTEEAESTSIAMVPGNYHTYGEYLGKTMHGSYANFKIGALGKMENLMLLQLNYVTFSGKRKKLPKKLRLLSWHGFSLPAIPGDISLEKLVVLDMRYSKLKRLWDDFKFIGSLKILNLSYSLELIETPDFYGLPNLENLILKGCSSLIKVDESIAYLKELVLLDLTNCSSLRHFPCLPTSLVSLKMTGCPNFGVLGLAQCMDSVPLSSCLEDVDLSHCNLFDNSFPNDWSSLVSLIYLNISGNNVTSLPEGIQTLPRIRELSVERCSKIKSIIGLSKFIDIVYLNNNKSLEKVQPAPNSRTQLVHNNCHKLCEMEGRYKLQPIENVDRKIIRYLGLELNADGGMELGLEVLHEFGIFSTFVSEKQIPSCFMYKETGPKISFKVPLHHSSSRINGFSLCAVLSESRRSRYRNPVLDIQVCNKTKDLLWKYINGNQKMPMNERKFAWLGVWRCGNLLEGGDELVISISHPEAMECCINILYDDDEQSDVERKEDHHVDMFDQISWTDRMDEDISDYVYSGKRHSFRSANRTT